jgi:hypothetical protein
VAKPVRGRVVHAGCGLQRQPGCGCRGQFLDADQQSDRQNGNALGFDMQVAKQTQNMLGGISSALADFISSSL